MKGKACFLLILTLIFLSRFLVFPKVSLWAATEASEAVNATVQISVCGNDIKEGGEDCDHADLNDQTCESIGYGPGTLDCQADCSFDVSGCGPAPTATPTPVATPTPTPTTATTATSAPGPTAASAPAPTATPTPIVVTVMEMLPLPKKVATFDIDGDGRIAEAEIKEAVELWVKEWRKEFKKEGAEVAPLVEEKAKEKEEVVKEKPKNLWERLWPFGGEEEAPMAEEELPLGVVQEEKQGVAGAVRFWLARRLGMAEPEVVPGPPEEEAFKSKLEKALETEEEKAAFPVEKKCDINKDEECNLIDFSVLMYYINS